MEKISFIRNYEKGNQKSLKRWEAWTSDGPNGAYFGTASSRDLQTIELSSNPSPNGDYINASLIVVSGPGAGQIRRIKSYQNRIWNLDAPLAVNIDPTESKISIVPYRANVLIAGNDFFNGTVVQTFGSSYYTIISDNQLSDMLQWSFIGPPGIVAFGLDYQGGVQPCFFTEISGNELVSGGAIQSRSVSSAMFSGPHIRAIVIKNNLLSESSNVEVLGESSDVIVESNTFRTLGRKSAVVVDSSADHVYQAGNVIQ
eukprot:TRINITY_DN13669_c0_g1_i1.p2 TRINITY_DN13669_c0_g1~~TRINITY_DN13669_c0_g1_i1.p2  ORF type:complete len:257 (+),score=51.11 TRINITY_DN13669_c0_g1_i1:1309-2079(+)